MRNKVECLPFPFECPALLFFTSCSRCPIFDPGACVKHKVFLHDCILYTAGKGGIGSGIKIHTPNA